MEIGSPTFATDLIRTIEERILGRVQNGAQVRRQLGTVDTYDASTNTASVFLAGPNYPSSGGFRVRSAASPVAGDLVAVCLLGQDRWIDSVLRGEARSKIEAFITAGYFDLAEIAKPSTNPASGWRRLYFKSDGHLYGLNSSGAETDLSSGGTGAPTDANYLVGTAHAGLSAEIVVGTSPGGELGGTWASPTVGATHSGSAHHSNTNDPSADQKAALAGTNGTPSASNKYVTDSDPRLSTTGKTVIRPSVSGTVNNWNPTGLAHDVIIAPALGGANRICTGIAAKSDGAVIYISTTTVDTFTLNHLDGGSSAANQVTCPGGTNYVITNKAGAMLWYDGTDALWRIIDK